jgi:superfamily II DNA or RNA helicase
MSYTLRDYQIEGINKIFKEFRNGKRSVLYQMPTGTGKTVLFCEIAKRGNDNNRNVVIVAHRLELIEQIAQKLREKAVDCGIIMNGFEPDYSKKIQVASIQTLIKRKLPGANLVIIDEAHHSKAVSYKKLWELFPHAKILGVTATPIRLNGEGFTDLFETLIKSGQIKDFISKGHLCPIRQFITAPPDLSKAKIRQGDYEIAYIRSAMESERVMANVIESYMKECNGKSTILFAVDISHSKLLVERYNKAGISAAHIDGTTPRDEREKILKDFKEGKYKIVSNVEIITEGFDFPDCEVVQLARPTKSLALYLQMVGRVMRPSNKKEFGVVLDNAGLWVDHGLATIDRTWTLEGKKRKKKEENEEDSYAIDEMGKIHNITDRYPLEIPGLELVEFNPDIIRLQIFEGFLSYATANMKKLLTPYYRYRQYIYDSSKEMITAFEFAYIRKRLEKMCNKVNTELKIKPGFWMFEQSRYNSMQNIELKENKN